MHELNAILEEWRGLEAGDRSAVLATVVHVKGSAYRRPGARMLILPDGRRIGSISGGCLEGDVSKKAWWWTEDGKPVLRIYDTTSDDDAVWEFGLGCNGVIEVLLERVNTPSAHAALQFLDAVCSADNAAVMATVIHANGNTSVQIGDRAFAGGTWTGPLAWRRNELEDAVEQTLREKSSRLLHLFDCDVFVEWIGPPQSLVIFGAGHDAIPVAGIAKQLGWRVTVADGRPAYATQARFPGVDKVVVMRPDNLLAGIEINRETAVVMMTHNYPQDARLLSGILPRQPRYLGMLGPIRRAEGLFAELGVRRDSVDAHAPVGLDIGAETPEAIAVSIIAEIQAELSSRAGMKLRYRRGPIHAPVLESGTAAGVPAPEPAIPVCELR